MLLDDAVRRWLIRRTDVEVLGSVRSADVLCKVSMYSVYCTRSITLQVRISPVTDRRQQTTLTNPCTGDIKAADSNIRLIKMVKGKGAYSC